MKIAFCGAHGTGKTTLLKEVAPLIKNHKIIDEVIRKEFKDKVKLNEQSTDKTQILIFNRYLEMLLLEDNFISDRSILDVTVYTQWLYNQNKVTNLVHNYVLDFYKVYIKLYDFLFYIPVEFNLEKDGVRSNNQTFQKDIDRLFYTFYKTLSKTQNCILVSGNILKRKKLVTSTILDAVINKNYKLN